MPLWPQPLLKHYVLIRWFCSAHGWYETGTLIAMHTSQCPECRQPAELVECCEGQTSRQLPFVTRPRLTSEPDGGWQVTNSAGVTVRAKSDKESRLRAGKKATGRPKRKAAPAEPITRYTIEDLDNDD